MDSDTRSREENPAKVRWRARDLASGWRRWLLYWGLPLGAFALGFAVAPWGRTLLWTLSLGAMGTACMVNARRCRRVHCYFTGPLFMAGAIASLTYGMGWLPLGDDGWNLIAKSVGIGALVLWYAPERLWGKYFP